MRQKILTSSTALAASLMGLAASSAFSQVTIVDWGGDYVTANQSSQASLQDISEVPTASDSIRQIGGFNVLANPTVGPDYGGTSDVFYGGAQVVKFGLDAANGSATAQVVNDAGGDYISLFAQSPDGTTNSHLNYIAAWDAGGVTYSDLDAFSGRTAGGVSGSVISRFMVETSGGNLYLSNTSISGGFGGSTWSISDLASEQWALFTPGANDWRGDFGSLTFDTALSSETLAKVGWFASRDSDVAGFTNATLTIREFDVTAVPEPSTVALGVGMVAFGAVLLRRRIRRD
jgi:hypothetical protein